MIPQGNRGCNEKWRRNHGNGSKTWIHNGGGVRIPRSISRPIMYRLLGAGAIESYHIGVRRYFTRENLDRLINERIGLGPKDDDSLS